MKSLPVVISRPRKRLKVDKSSCVTVIFDAPGNARWRLSHTPPKHWRRPTSEAIRKARIRANLTQREAAETCGYSSSSWRAWESGKRGMHPVIWQVFQRQVR